MEQKTLLKKAWCDMNRQLQGRLTLRLSSHTAPTSLFQVSTQEQASNRK